MMKNWPKFSGEIGRRPRSKWWQTPFTYAQIFLFFFSYLFYVLALFPTTRRAATNPAELTRQQMNNI
jgi:hypothetical protein